MSSHQRSRPLRPKDSSEFVLDDESEDSDMDDNRYHYDDDDHADHDFHLEDGERLLRAPLHVETRSFPQLSLSPKQQQPPASLLLREYGWLVLNVVAWSVATAMAARAMKFWSLHVLEEWNQSDNSNPTARSQSGTIEQMTWMDRVALATTVTAIQLLLGGFLGQATLVWVQRLHASSALHQAPVSSPASGVSVASLPPPLREAGVLSSVRRQLHPNPGPPMTPAWIRLGPHYSLGPVQVLGVLHALGSLGANYGYMVGDEGAHTCVVQMIRLLEPFETMIWTQGFLPQSKEANIVSGALLSAVMLTCGGAISLLDRASPTATDNELLTHPLLFALASGVCHSCRIVLQRLHNQSLSATTPVLVGANTGTFLHHSSSHSSLPSPLSGGSHSKPSHVSLHPHFQHHHHQHQVPPTNKVERILWQFRQLSLESAKWTMAATLGVHLYKWLHHDTWSLQHLGAVLSWHSLSLWTWHPLFNLGSMMTLGYCAALTHSILTVCRRTVTVLWEGTVTDDLAGGVLVLVGVAWYLRLVLEQQQLVQPASRKPWLSSTWTNWLKVIQPLVVLTVLQFVYSTRTYTIHGHASKGQGGI